MKLQYLSMLACSLFCLACGDVESVATLKSKIDQEMKKPPPPNAVPQLEMDRPSNIQTYNEADLNKADPFSDKKIAAVIGSPNQGDNEACAKTLKSLKDRSQREIGATVSLENIRFVGVVENKSVSNSIQKQKANNSNTSKKGLYAVVVIDGKTITVATGQILGQNYGVITGITEAEIQLLETVESSVGDCPTREVSLTLNESTK